MQFSCFGQTKRANRMTSSNLAAMDRQNTDLAAKISTRVVKTSITAEKINMTVEKISTSRQNHTSRQLSHTNRLLSRTSQIPRNRTLRSPKLTNRLQNLINLTPPSHTNLT